MALPVVSVVQPASIKAVPTASIDKTTHLVRVFFPGVGYSYLHPLAARAWNALVLLCLAATGQTLTAVSTADVFRAFWVQENAFNQRYTDTYSLAVNGLVNKYKNKRFYKGKWWYLRKGVIPCAVPGTGWHPRGLAIDVAIWDKTLTDANSFLGGARNIRSNAVVWKWLIANAGSCGFSWEYSQEGVDDPHLHYFAGDNLPKAVIELEQALARLGGKG